jgi:hypothetical protein
LRWLALLLLFGGGFLESWMSSENVQPEIFRGGAKPKIDTSAELTDLEPHHCLPRQHLSKLNAITQAFNRPLINPTSFKSICTSSTPASHTNYDVGHGRFLDLLVSASEVPFTLVKICFTLHTMQARSSPTHYDTTLFIC